MPEISPRIFHRRGHPDKNPGDKEAHAKFQDLQEVYSILGDPERRKAYDETGITTDGLSGTKSDDLTAYFKAQYNPVTADAIDEFMDGYCGSEEEQRDVLRTYSRTCGNMNHLFAYVMCSNRSRDSHRFMDMLEVAIEKGFVERFETFTAWAAKVAARPRPAKPLKKKRSRSAAAGPSSSLVAAITQQSAARAAAGEAFLTHLEAKYCTSKKRK